MKDNTLHEKILIAALAATRKTFGEEVCPPSIMKADGDNEFITRFDMMDDITIYDTDDDNYANVSIKWEAYFETRSYGIKDAGVYTSQVQIEIFDDNDNMIEQIDTSIDKQWEIKDDNYNINFGGKVHPTSIEIDLKKKKLYIYW
tara:strand:- start:101 stop:535 length:435 start_codon:yes stop_codon:yes gene_type:complete